MIAAFEDFRKFVYHVWMNLGLPKPTTRQYEIADVIQNVIKHAGLVPLKPDPNFKLNYKMMFDTEGECTRRIIIEAFRGVGKSWLSSTATAWVLMWNKRLNIMALSAAKQKSDEFTTFTLKLLRDIPELNFLLPDKSLGDRCSALAFDVKGGSASHAPSVRSIGIFGMVTGGRADLAFLDDIEVPKTSETQLLREKLAHRISEVGGAVLKPKGVVIYLGTPQCEETVYDLLERERGYIKIIFPSRYPSNKWLSTHGHALAPSLVKHLELVGEKLQTGGGLDGTLGIPTDPQRFNEQDLQRREAEHGRTGFALQFQLDTSLSDAERFPLRLRDLIVMDVGDKVPASPVWSSDPDMEWKDLAEFNPGLRGDRFYRPLNLKIKDQEWLDLVGSAMYIDPAGRGKDELAFSIGKTCNGWIYLKACKGFKHGYSPETLKIIAEYAKKYNVQEIVVEPNFGDGMFKALLEPVLRDLYPCTVTDSEWSTVQKEKRICDVLEPVCNSHMLIVDPEVIKDQYNFHEEDEPETATLRNLFYQFSRITRDKGCLRCDDRIDSLAGLVNYFKKNLGIQQQEAAKRRQVDYMKALIELCNNHNPFKKEKEKASWLNIRSL